MFTHTSLKGWIIDFEYIQLNWISLSTFYFFLTYSGTFTHSRNFVESMKPFRPAFFASLYNALARPLLPKGKTGGEIRGSHHRLLVS